MNKKAAFTLIEILIAVTIIGILATAIALRLYQSRDNANYGRILSDFDAISKAATVYRSNSTDSAYPASAAAGTMPTGLSNYLPKWPEPPCSDWKYKWDIDSGIQVWIQNSDVTPVKKYYYCLSGSCSGGTDIKTITSVACD